MKKILFCIILIPIITAIYAEDVFDVNWSMGNLGYGINYSADKDSTMEITVSLINLIFEHQYINLGMEFTQAKYWFAFEFQNASENKATSKFSFLNATLYWDIPEYEYIVFGPFVSINYLFLNIPGEFDWNDYIFTGGLRFAFRLTGNAAFYNLNIVSSEIGYRNIMGKSNFYFSINTDLVLALLYWLR